MPAFKVGDRYYVAKDRIWIYNDAYDANSKNRNRGGWYISAPGEKIITNVWWDVGEATPSQTYRSGATAILAVRTPANSWTDGWIRDDDNITAARFTTTSYNMDYDDTGFSVDYYAQAGITLLFEVLHGGTRVYSRTLERGANQPTGNRVLRLGFSPSNFPQYFNTGTTVNFTVRMTTYLGMTTAASSQIGTSTAYLTVRATNLPPAIVTAPTLEVTGNKKGGSGVVGDSKLVVRTGSAQAYFGARISRTEIVFEGITYSSSQNTSRTFDITNGSYSSVTVRHVDSRGQTASRTLRYSTTVEDGLEVTNYRVERVGDTGIRVQSNFATEPKYSRYTVRIRVLTLSGSQVHSTTTTVGTLNSSISYLYNRTVSSTSIRPTESYRIEMRVTDAGGRSATMVSTIGTTNVPFSIGDKGAGVGGVYQKGQGSLQATGGLVGSGNPPAIRTFGDILLTGGGNVLIENSDGTVADMVSYESLAKTDNEIRNGGTLVFGSGIMIFHLTVGLNNSPDRVIKTVMLNYLLPSSLSFVDTPEVIMTPLSYVTNHHISLTPGTSKERIFFYHQHVDRVNLIAIGRWK